MFSRLPGGKPMTGEISLRFVPVHKGCTELLVRPHKVKSLFLDKSLASQRNFCAP